MSERKFCRCLLEDVAPDMARSVAEYIAVLPQEQKVPDDVRASRLAVCLSCSFLLNGTCRLCGCYVEARTAKKAIACADVPPRWTAW